MRIARELTAVVFFAVSEILDRLARVLSEEDLDEDAAEAGTSSLQRGVEVSYVVRLNQN